MRALLALLLAAHALAGERNDPETLWQRAEAYYFGKGVPQNCALAVRHYEKAAELGHGASATRLGELHFVGKSCGYKKDLKKALPWFEKGVAAGHPDAMVHLGFMHNHGMAVKKDYKKAMALYLLAAEKGDGQAMHNIAYMYRHGQGVSRDLEKAAEWEKKGDPILKARGLPTSRPP